MGETPKVSGKRAPGAEDFAMLYPSLANSVMLWCATQVLKSAGFSVEDAARALNEVYGVEVPREVIEAWYASNEAPKFIKKACTRNIGLRDFVKLLEAERVKDYLWALRYIAGAAIGDGDHGGRLRVKDWQFAHTYALALAIVTGDLNIVFRVRRTNDGGLCVGRSRLVSFIINSGLWRILAYLDRIEEIKHFLAGLMDAEGSISPRLDKIWKNLKAQIWFTNTNAELVEYVEGALRELGFNPKQTTPQLPDIGRINGKTVVRKKPLFRLYMGVSLPKLLTFARKVGFRCSRKMRLLSFLILIASLPPPLRYEVFSRCWVKRDGKWQPTSCDGQLEYLFQLQLSIRRGIERRRRRKVYIVLCPVCRRPGIFALHRELIGERMLVQVRVLHGNEVCTLNLAEKEIKEGDKPTLLITCKCGRLGYVYVCGFKVVKGKRCYKYLKIGVSHHTPTGTKHCILEYISVLLSTEAESNQTSPSPHFPCASSKP